MFRRVVCQALETVCHVHLNQTSASASIHRYKATKPAAQCNVKASGPKSNISLVPVYTYKEGIELRSDLNISP